MSSLTVLLTNFDLAIRGGSQLYVRDVARGLLRRGHRPIVYSPVLGDVAWELTAATVPVVSDLAKITIAPDIIHGQHNHELITALLRFPGVPAVRLCHGWVDEAPQPFPRVLRYVAVDDTTRDRCVCEWGIPPDRLDVLLNFADLETFTLRSPLPARPARALVFSNTATGSLRTITAACAATGIAVDSIGHDVGRVTADPERVLREYDLVFAKGRAAIEALACGAAVILCDSAGLGPMITMANVRQLQRLNFGVRTLNEPLDGDGIEREIARYDPDDAGQVTQHIRATAAADAAIESLIGVYRAVIAEAADGDSGSAAEDLRAASTYLQRIGPKLRWAENPRAMRYLVLRSLNGQAQRIPGVRTLLRADWARQLVRGARARWRARATGPS
jgi:Glycosyltransferase Family 4